MIIKVYPFDDKGQMSIDYIIGISIFIFSFFFLYSILDSLFLPLQGNSDEVQPMAERASSILVESTKLAIDSSSPNIIDENKVIDFNSSLNGNYEEELSKIGLVTTNLKYNLNVSLRYFNDTQYPNSSNSLLNAGRITDDNIKVGQIVRLVCLSQDISKDCTRLKLVVRVWL
jgi:hypothetical protein